MRGTELLGVQPEAASLGSFEVFGGIWDFIPRDSGGGGGEKATGDFIRSVMFTFCRDPSAALERLG